MSLELDTTVFDAAMRDLARMTGKNFRDVIHNEAHAILKKCVKDTEAASPSVIKAHFDYKGEGPTPKSVIDRVTLNGKQIRVRSIRKRGKWIHRKKGNRFDKNAVNPQFRELQKVLKARFKWAKDRRGQSKATWLYIAKMAKLKSITAPAYVRKAYGLLPRSLKKELKGKDVGIGSGNYHLLLTNKGKTVMAPKSRKGPGGFAAFKTAYDGRIRFFRVNMTKGAFTSAEKTLRKYPGLVVSE